MADHDAKHSLGEDILKLNEVEVVEVDAAQTIVAGQALKVTGFTALDSGSRAQVSVAGAGDKARFVAMTGGTAGANIQALRKGKTKVTFGGAVAVGAAVKAGATGKFVAAVTTVTVPTGGAGTGDGGALTVEAGIACGWNYQTIAADNDTGDIWFEGGA